MRPDAHNARRSARLCPRRVALIALMVAVAPIAGVVIDAERASGAAPQWHQMPPAAAPEAANGWLNDVSCASETFCVAVGARLAGTTQTAIVEQWNGTTWALVASPAAAAPSSLSGVACANANRCIAVGFFQGTDGSSKALVEAWNGVVWSTMTTPKPSGSIYTSLSSVACPSATSCFAVGAFGTSTAGRALAAHWNGRTWSIMATPNAEFGPHSAALTGVSCPTRTNCFAVGRVSQYGEGTPLVEYWNGRTWKVQASRTPTGTSDAALGAVSCSGPKHCFAVGTDVRPGFLLPLAERWNGSKWSIAKLKDPMAGQPAIRITALRDVTCVSANNCYAVGSSRGTLIEHWNGNGWRIQPSPSPFPYTEDSSPTLRGVTCTAAKKCFAVGAGNGTLLLRYP